MEITGYYNGTEWTVVHNLPAVKLQAVTFCLAVWFLVLPYKVYQNNSQHSQCHKKKSRGGF